MNFVKSIEDALAARLKTAAPGSDMQKIWLDNLIHATETSDGMNRLAGYLSGQTKLKSMKLDEDRRWEILKRMCRANVADVDQMVATEEKVDSTSRGKDNKLACLASIPNLENKKTWYAQIKSEKSDYSFQQMSQIMGNLFPYQQHELQKPFSDDYFAFLAKTLTAIKNT